MQTLTELEMLAKIAAATGDRERLAELEDLIDAAENAAKPPPCSMLDAALWYASQGLRVFPCKALRKEPATRQGFKDACSGEVQMYQWWSVDPNYNIGIATGDVVDVVDVDGYEAAGLWSNMRKVIPDAPEVLGIATTRRPGGAHYYVSADPKIGSRPGDPKSGHPGIDYKGVGGYVIAPPSVVELQDEHDNYLPGTGVRYVWRRPLRLPEVTT